MCLAVPGQIVSFEPPAEPGDLTMARVDFGGVTKQVCTAYVPEATVGDYVIVHVGFAITRLDAEEANRTLALLDEWNGSPTDSGQG